MLHAQEHTAKIDIDDPVPFLFRDIGRRRNWLFDTGVVEGEVEASEVSTVFSKAAFTSCPATHRI